MSKSKLLKIILSNNVLVNLVAHKRGKTGNRACDPFEKKNKLIIKLNLTNTKKLKSKCY